MQTMMSLRQFESLARSYGADLSRWPAAERDLASALLARTDDPASRTATAILQAERLLDGVIGDAFAADEAESWQDGEQDAALARLRSDLDRRIAAMPAGWRQRLRRSPAWRVSGLPAAGSGAVAVRWVGATAGSGLLVAAGLWVGLMQPVHAQPALDLLGALQLTPLGSLQ